METPNDLPELHPDLLTDEPIGLFNNDRHERRIGTAPFLVAGFVLNFGIGWMVAGLADWTGLSRADAAILIGKVYLLQIAIFTGLAATAWLSGFMKVNLKCVGAFVIGSGAGLALGLSG